MPSQIQTLIEVLDAEADCYLNMQTVLSDEDISNMNSSSEASEQDQQEEAAENTEETK